MGVRNRIVNKVQNELPERNHSHRLGRGYAVEIAPRSWLGRVLVGSVVAALLVAGFFFFSVLVAVGAAIIVLAVAIGILKYILGGRTYPGRRAGADRPGIIDTERSAHDGVYRPRDSKNP